MASEKYVDESWKNEVEKEREAAEEPRPQQSAGQPAGQENPEADGQGREEHSQHDHGHDVPDLNFTGYISSLAFQAMVFLGQMPNPLTNQEEKNLPQAKFLIDTLRLLREKTTGNLSKEEADSLNAFIYELEMKYVDVLKEEGGEERGNS